MARLCVLFIFLFTQLALADINPLTLTMTPSKVSVESKKENNKEIIDLREKLRSPQETMRFFITAMDKIKSGNNSAFKDAIQTLDLSQIAPALRDLTGKITIERLINTIDRIAKVNLAHVPNYETRPKWYFRKQTVSVGNNVYDVEIAIGKSEDGVWRFTPETVSTIENFYSSVSKQPVLSGVTEYRNWRTRFKDRMPDWTSEEVLMLKKGQWLGLLALLFISFSFFAIARFIITLYLRFKVRDRFLEIDEKERFKSTLPFGLLAFSVCWLVGVRLLELDVEMLEVFIRTSYILTAFFSVWSTLKIVDYVGLHFQKKAKLRGNKFDDVLIPMMKKTSKVVVVAFGILLIAHSLTFDIASILAGLGIGGVAVALAAKDTISNLFGSVTVLIDRPFQIGDYIVLGKDLEGSVEQVGFRSTRIRTPLNSLVTLPNSVLANMAIDNYGMRRMRRFKTTLQLVHTTPLDKLQEFCDRIRYEIQLHPLILKDDHSVTIYELGHSSVDILLTVFFVTGELKVELAERHKFILSILKIAEEIGVKFAYPTQTVFLENTKDEHAKHP